MWEQIVLNLLSNAVKFTSRADHSPPGSIGDDAMLSVADTGIGIAPDDSAASSIGSIASRTHAHAQRRAPESGSHSFPNWSRSTAGAIAVDERLSEVGTTFAVRLPQRQAHLPAEQVTARPPRPRLAVLEPFLLESLGWFDKHTSRAPQPGEQREG